MATTKFLKKGGATGITEESTIDTSAGAADAGKVPSLNASGKLDSSFLPSGGGSVSTDTIWDAKGDLAVGTGADTAAKLTVGADGKKLYADSSQSTGLRWGPSIISPSQITSDQDNYSPTGWAAAQIVKIDADSGIRAITGFSATFDGDEKTIFNVGSYAFYIPGEHPDSTASNRVKAGKDCILPPGFSTKIIYDSTLSRWLILDKDGGSRPSTSKLVLYEIAPGSSSAGDLHDAGLSVINSGSVGTFSATSTTPLGGWQCSTQTLSTNGAFVVAPKSTGALLYLGSGHIFSDALISITTLSDATNTFQAGNMIMNSPTTAPTFQANNSVGIRYTHGTNSGKWEGFSQNNSGSTSTVDLGITVAAGTIYNLRVELDKALTEARFYIDGVYAGRLTTNLPTTTSAGARAVILKSAGTTARTLNVHRYSLGAIVN